MTNSEIQCLKDNVDRLVELETTDGEVIVAKVLSVFHDEKDDEHELFYEVLSSSEPHFYALSQASRTYAMDFEYIFSVKPHLGGANGDQAASS